jgi:molecular chaperone GrpE
MDRRTISIPVKVRQSIEHQTADTGLQSSMPRASDGALYERESVETRPREEDQVTPTVETAPETVTPEVDSQDEATEWRDRALRLQAEMDNFRKRQQRLAHDQVETERQRLLNAFLQVADNLERALAAPTSDDEGLHRGVQLTHRAALQLLQKEGVEQIEALNRAFDPTWHEAVATIGRNGTDAGPGTVVQVMEPGYRMGDQLLRPAKVVVAVQQASH